MSYISSVRLSTSFAVVGLMECDRCASAHRVHVEVLTRLLRKSGGKLVCLSWSVIPSVRRVRLGLAMEAKCMPLTHFCQVALTRSAAGGTSPVEVITPTPPARHVPLLNQAASLLHHHLPALSTGGGGNVNLTPLVNTIVAGQQQRAAEQAQAQADKLRKDNTTVESWLGPENFQHLLKYCGAAGEADLPPLWAALAKATAKD